MIHHIVMFRLAGSVEAIVAAAGEFKNALETLPSKIESLKAMECHLDTGTIAGNWTLVLHAQCEDEAKLAAYAAHPAHIACVAIIKPYIADRACVDYLA